MASGTCKWVNTRKLLHVMELEPLILTVLCNWKHRVLFKDTECL